MPAPGKYCQSDAWVAEPDGARMSGFGGEYQSDSHTRARLRYMPNARVGLPGPRAVYFALAQVSGVDFGLSPPALTALTT